MDDLAGLGALVLAFELNLALGLVSGSGSVSAADPSSVRGSALLSAFEAFDFLGAALGYGYVLASSVDGFADERVARGMMELLYLDIQVRAIREKTRVCMYSNGRTCRATFTSCL